MVAASSVPTRNVVILGASYAGARAAEVLSRTLPASYRVVCIDRQSHFNHLYLHPRVSVVPGHAEKVFIPYTGVLPAPPSSTPPKPTGADSTEASNAAATAVAKAVEGIKEAAQEAADASPEETAVAPQPLTRHVIVHASITSINEDFIEVDRDLLEHERDLDGDENEVAKLTDELEAAKLEAEPEEKESATRRLSWDYLVYALGCTLPPPLVSSYITKKDGVAFLSSQSEVISKATNILVAGGGALGIQYATDIADLYNNPENEKHLEPFTKNGSKPSKKRITLVHSRDRFLPLYKQDVHDEVTSRLEKLGVEVVLGERLPLPPIEEDEPGTMKTMKLADGREIKYDLLLRCTGQKPNSQLFRDFLPETLDEYGYINIRPTLQVDVSKVTDHEELNEKIRRNIYAIGDVANAGVIKAGHTGWNQAGVAVQNIMCCVETDLLNEKLDEGKEASEPALVSYERSPPQIKVSLGLSDSVSELLPSMEAKETVVTKATGGPVDGYYELLREVPSLPLGLYQHLRQVEHQQAYGAPVTHADSQVSFTNPSVASSRYPEYYFDQLVSHDPSVPPPHPNATFQQRYWFDASFYKPGGPVILLDGGETDGQGRLPFLEKGILRILSEATGGIGVVFEHRYYGKSFPVDQLTTDSYRFLTTLQALHDQAHFARTISFPGLEHLNLTAPSTAWIVYGGSYAGAKAAFARKLFPDVWWGGIASSAVTTAIVDFWEYYDPIRLNAPTDCISRLTNHTTLIDSLLSLHNSFITNSLKSFFGLPNVTRDDDFVNALAIPLGSWQARNWDPKVGSHLFSAFCAAIEEDKPASALPDIPNVFEAVLDKLSHLLPASLTWPKDPRSRYSAFSSYAAFIKEHIASACPEGMPQDACFGTEVYDGTGLEDASWKSWSYQFCTEWGYFIGAAPPEHSSLVSRLITPDYTGQICKKAFPPGKLNRVPSEPNVTVINQYGSFELSYPRLAFIDGSADPWLYATPHSPHAKKSGKRKDTLRKPFKLIPGGVHHWDENGLLDPCSEPQEIAQVHAEEIKFVKKWMREWRERGRWKWKGFGVEDGERDVGRWD
ncbi:hypothetical protein JCM11641_005997 [Rhodosporidiobolus odoratus]